RLGPAEQALTRMRHLLDDLMDSVRIGGGRFSVHFAPTDIAQLARVTVADESLVHPDHVLDVWAPEHLLVDGDEDRLRQVVVNIITSACKYSPAGTRVRVVVSEHDDVARLSISDQG